MWHSTRLFSTMLPAAQIAGAVLISAVVVLAPPAHGRMLIVAGPAASGQPADLLAIGRRPVDRARLLGTGPFPGSLIVLGDRATLLSPALGHGMLVLAAPGFICGDAAPAVRP